MDVQFQRKDASKYERFKQIDTINLFKYLFESEIDIEKFEKEGFVIDHFPLHQYRKKKEVFDAWKKYMLPLILGILFNRKDNRMYKGLLAFSFYHGKTIGFFMGFIVVYTTWLIILAIPQVLFWMFIRIFANTYPTYYIYSVGINIIWSFCFLANFRKRQLLFRDLFESGVRKNEMKSISQRYKGDFVINKVTNQVTVFDKFTPFKRRILVIFLNHEILFFVSNFLLDRYSLYSIGDSFGLYILKFELMAD